MMRCSYNAAIIDLSGTPFFGRRELQGGRQQLHFAAQQLYCFVASGSACRLVTALLM